MIPLPQPLTLLTVILFGVKAAAADWMGGCDN
jgi:hypothetical protein